MPSIKLPLVVFLAVSLSACASYVKRDEFDSTVADLRATDASLGATDTSLRNQLERMQAQFGELSQSLQSSLSRYDAQIAELQGRVRVDMSAHFAYDDATLRDQDKAALNDFSSVLRDFHENVIITVEGFTDPAGNADYNRWLGMERAKAVRNYLIENGLDAGKVRAVSYGEDENRQIAPGAWGQNGESNRRVALVIDYVAS